MMKIGWTFASDYSIDPSIDASKIKDIGPTWGSWKTWRSCGTDNVICHDRVKCQELLGRAFQAVCNFHMPKKIYQDCNRPVGVKLYDGDFEQEVDNLEDIIALHLAGSNLDIILMLGYDLSKPPQTEDVYQKHKLQNYHGLIRSVITKNIHVQWVAVDHPGEFDSAYQNIPNLTCDTMENALKLLL